MIKTPIYHAHPQQNAHMIETPIYRVSLTGNVLGQTMRNIPFVRPNA
jgi:hypothetical protein